LLHQQMRTTKRDIVVIGASAGGIEVMLTLVKTLPEELNASVFVVMHLPPAHKSSLDKILTKAGNLKVEFATDGAKFKKGVVYLAPPDYHLLIENDRMLVKRGPKENRFRPSIDALFRSAAYNYGSRVIGIILTGLLDDGTSGLWSIKRLGGVALVQNPSEAMYHDMPLSALQQVDIDLIVSVDEIPEILNEYMSEPVNNSNGLNDHDNERMGKEVRIAAEDNALDSGVMQMGNTSPFTCPECHGVLVSIQEGNHVRFRCHTGHAFSSSALLDELTKSVEDSFRNTLRGLEETIMLLETKGKELESAGDRETAKEYYRKAQEVRDQCQQIRRIIFEHERMSEDKIEEKIKQH